MGRTGCSHMGFAADKCKEKPKNWCLHHVHICLRCPSRSTSLTPYRSARRDAKGEGSLRGTQLAK
jgi:hypothetical protein